MRLSKRFKLGVSQFELDFVDIDPNRDVRLFLDPHFLGQRADRWSIDATTLIQGFFGHFLSLLQLKQDAEAFKLFQHLGEPNETCLGYSKGAPQGSGVGRKLAERLFNSIKSSKAVATGVLQDLEDAQVFVEDIGRDRISDMTTAILRGHLIDYTIGQCNHWGIPLTPNVPSNDVWDNMTKKWTSVYATRLVISGKPILLVPKAVVSYARVYTSSQYHQHFVLNYFQNYHLSIQSALVKRRYKKGMLVKEYVTKKSIVKEGYSSSNKDRLAEFTKVHPEVFLTFKAEHAKDLTSIPLDEFARAGELTKVVEHLVGALASTSKGPAHATEYHRLVACILDLLFYPDLFNLRMELKINEGRKRVDIVCENAQTPGSFFHRLAHVHGIACAYVFMECKNYSRPLANPELDQLNGRFNVNNGRFGFIVSRDSEGMGDLIQRCRDLYSQQKNVIIPLVDDDLVRLLNALVASDVKFRDQLLSDRLASIVL